MSKFLSLPPALIAYASLPIWMLWKAEFRSAKNKWTKVPYRASNPNRKAKCNDPSTWAPFADALAALQAGHGDGIGFVIRDTDLGAQDLDDCRDPQTGDLQPYARYLVDQANSYAEITPSDAGLRIFVRATGPKLHRRQPVPSANGMFVETYRKCERFITVTGNALPGTPSQIADGDLLLDQTVARLDAAKRAAKSAKGSARQGRKQKLNLADVIKNGEGGHFGGDRSKAVWWVTVSIAWEETHSIFGGVRCWWRCPGCSARRRFLRVKDGHMACTACLDLTYRSRAVRWKTSRALYRVARLRARIGADPRPFSLLPLHPVRVKGYNRIVQELQLCERELLGTFAPR